ncbi:NAD-dependent epimerase/dehydratase family protein [Aquincola tertiaricarbonis]|uniref:NAD-dependent epimerase/dehydratase family protein n=1 Tax=Aquincola tertiaricarbonis TaxID=391953 RepID=UPI000614DF21|nr:NAD-dependent epimerase/dehydratase family protein [Aquincola tertiaricarbonis]
MRIVLLGGTGFIGRHLASYCQPGADIVIVSRHAPMNVDRLPGVRYVQGDSASQDFLRQVIRADDHVVYLAYNSVPKTSFDDPLRDIQENLPLAISLLSVLRDVPVKRLLYVSSGGTVYGPTEEAAPIAEDHPTHPISPYGITKLAVEKYCRMYARLFGIPVVIARPSNPYGPGQVPYRGQGFIATAVAKILQGDEMPVFGPHGTVRDYLYIEDLCAAMKVLLHSQPAPGAIFNIGSGIGLNNLQVLQAVAEAAGRKMSEVKVDFLPARHFDVAYNVLDSSRLEALGWSCRTTLAQGLPATIQWVTAHLSAA